ncbi:mCG60907 [Mus musculus]|nr:mCG60907 [Mus musculus]
MGQVGLKEMRCVCLFGSWRTEKSSNLASSNLRCSDRPHDQACRGGVVVPIRPPARLGRHFALRLSSSSQQWR